jgi:hypothetical protein
MKTRNYLFSLVCFLTLTIKEHYTVQVTISETITTVTFTGATLTGAPSTIVLTTIGNQGNSVFLNVPIVDTTRVPLQDMIITLSSFLTDVNVDGTDTSTVSEGGTTVFTTISDGSSPGGGTITSTATVTVTSGSGGSGGSPGLSGGDKKVTLSPITRLVIVKQFLPPTTSTATLTITIFRVDETTVEPSPLTTTVTTRRPLARDPYYNHREPNYNYY